MKKILLVLLVSTLLSSCNSTPKKDYILFSGKILNTKSREFRLTKIGEGSENKKITLEEDGTFLDTITSGTGFYFLHNPRQRVDLYLPNGGDFNLTIDAENFRSSGKLTGKDSEASNFMLTKNERYYSLIGNTTEYFLLSETDFKIKSKKVEESLSKYLDSFPNTTKDFLEFRRKELKYNRLYKLINYENSHRVYSKNNNFNVSPGFYDELEEFDFLNEEDYKMSYPYKKLVKWYYQKEIDALIAQENIDKSLAKLKVYNKVPNEFIKNNLISTAAFFGISETKEIEEYYEYYLSIANSKTEKVTKKYNNLIKIAKGKPSPEFTDYINHAGGKTSLSDLEGKYVYIDVWATWCAPCLAEVPFLKEIEEDYKNKKIHFVSLSIDTEKHFEKWKKMVTNKKMGGIQLIADKNWSSEFVSEYQINGIPRFILLDPKGNIVDAHAPRPSDSKLIDLFNELNL
ncbi:hypothetical protein BTO15_16230 [Polaribacter sejongensis]|uniref:Thioredoxin domain-containing protein n=1 Tax=Polaribacter sejongensis TaxID=985043 RepID=A0ABM6Q384_9FLAO|nr:TlpA disulfide reductase family protein [Polaribacter sejongensis]AUC23552.1 hypothetical protein BTO15_16230 [Polaribacter sejongensis]